MVLITSLVVSQLVSKSKSFISCKILLFEQSGESKFLSPLCSNNKILHEINDLLFDFLWNGKGDKIKRKVMINDLREGGINMIDLISFNKALKTTWTNKYLDIITTMGNAKSF